MDKNSMCEEIRFIIYQELAKKYRITPAFIIKKTQFGYADLDNNYQQPDPLLNAAEDYEKPT
jgi:hypothetical protein